MWYNLINSFKIISMSNRVSKIFQYLRDKLYSFLGFVKFIVVPQSKIFRAMLLGSIVFVVFGGVYIAHAEGPDFMDQVIGLINILLFWIAYCLGWVAMKVFALIVWISQYNDFVTSPAVTKGWVLVRDICNMFFVVILLVIAFAQILGVQKYSMKTLLPKVLIAAVLVNFSKLLCGLMIDMAQVVMMTFVNGYQATAGANLIQGLGLTKLLQLNEAATTEGAGTGPKASEIMLALVIAIFIIIATIFVAFFIALLLLLRIVTLWILVVLSPAAFALSTVPFGQGKYNEWWQKFGWNVAVGPFMAFFLWLSLLIMSNPEEMMGANNKMTEASQGIEQKAGGQAGQISYLNNIAQAAIGLAMLFASLVVAQEAGGAMASLASKGQKVTAGALKTVAMKASGAQAVRDRGAAMYGGWKEGREAKKAAIMATWKGRGSAAYEKKALAAGAIKKGTMAVGAVPMAMAGGAIARKLEMRKIAKQAEKAAGGGVAGKAAYKDAVAKYKEEHKGAAGRDARAIVRNMGVGSLDQRMASERKKQNLEVRRAEAKKNLEGAGIDNKEKREDLLNTAMVDAKGRDMQRAALLTMAEKGELTADYAKRGKDMFKGDKDGLKAFEDAMKKKQAHLAYGDLSDPKNIQSLAEDIDSGDVDLSKLDASAYEDATFMAAAHSAVGGKRFSADMDKVAKRSEKHKKAVSDTLKGDDFARQVISPRQQEMYEAESELAALNTISTSGRSPEQVEEINRRKAAAQKKLDNAKEETSKVTRTIASVTGDLNAAFAQRYQNTDPDHAENYTDDPNKVGQKTGGVDATQIQAFLKNASAKALAALKIEPAASITVAQSVSVSQLKNLSKSSEDGASKNLNEIIKEIAKQAAAGNAEMQRKAAEIFSRDDIKDALDEDIKTALASFAPAPRPTPPSPGPTPPPSPGPTPPPGPSPVLGPDGRPAR